MLGMPVSAEDVVTSGSVAAAEVAKHTSAAYVIGEPGLCEELQLAGVAVEEPSVPLEPFDEVRLTAAARAASSRVGAVVVGHDEQFSYAKLAFASLLLQLGGEECTLIGTNPDVANRTKAGYLVPEAGSLIAAVEAASGRLARVVGKPAPAALRQLMQRFGFQPEDVLVVGDRLDTDVAFGARAGARTCLVLSGVATAEEADKAEGEMRPDFVRACLAEVVS